MQKSRLSITRRDLLKTAAGATAAGLLGSVQSICTFAVATEANCFSKAQIQEKLPPVRQITHGPKHHWFGYYDKLEFDPTCRYVLGMEVDFEHRQPTIDDIIRVGMVDLQHNDQWIELGTSNAWCWQQGCMLQWRPGSKSEVVWNDRQDGHYVCRILDVFTGRKRTITHPIYTLSPDGRWAFASDFTRLSDCRSSYGYVGLPDVNKKCIGAGRLGHLSHRFRIG